MSDQSLKVGDTVTYSDVNLYDYRGTLVAIERGPRGSDCFVNWHSPRVVNGCPEWLSCLRRAEQ